MGDGGRAADMNEVHDEMGTADERPWCQGGPPRTLLDAVRSTVQPKGALGPQLSLTPRQVHARIRKSWPGWWPYASTLDVANEMQRFYG